jgi:hypothetical protein
LFITLSHDGEYGYYSSSRTDLGNENGGMDIYKFDIPALLEDILIISWQQEITANVDILLFDNNGSQVNYFSYTDSKPGNHSFIWDKKDDKGNICKPGKYLYNVQIGPDKPEMARILKIN